MVVFGMVWQPEAIAVSGRISRSMVALAGAHCPVRVDRRNDVVATDLADTVQTQRMAQVLSD
jgi:hypothetical protein